MRQCPTAKLSTHLEIGLLSKDVRKEVISGRTKDKEEQKEGWR